MSSRYMTPVLLLVAALVLGLYFLSQSTPPASETPASDVLSGQSEAPVAASKSKSEVEPAREAATREEVQARRRAGRDEAWALAQGVFKRFDLAEQEVTRWQTEIEPLLANDRGRTLSTSPDLVATFAVAYSESRPDPAELSAARHTVETLTAPLRTAVDLDDAAYTPSPSLLTDLNAKKTWAETFLSNYRTARERIEGILSRAPTSPTDSAAPTLAAAMDAQRRGRLADDADARRRDEEALARRREDLARDARLRAERVELDARDPQVLAEFEPLLQRRQKKLNGANWVGTTKPASLSELQRLGGTSDPLRFWAAGNLRGGAQWPESEPLDPTEVAAVKDRMDRFRELAPLWVKEGRLLP